MKIQAMDNFQSPPPLYGLIHVLLSEMALATLVECPLLLYAERWGERASLSIDYGAARDVITVYIHARYA
jgi:hypothetical protein